MRVPARSCICVIWEARVDKSPDLWSAEGSTRWGVGQGVTVCFDSMLENADQPESSRLVMCAKSFSVPNHNRRGVFSRNRIIAVEKSTLLNNILGITAGGDTRHLGGLGGANTLYHE